MKRILGSRDLQIVVLVATFLVLVVLVLGGLSTANEPSTAVPDPALAPHAVAACTDADAVDRPTRVADEIVADEHDADRYDVARMIYEAVLAESPGDACAGRGLAVLDDLEASAEKPSSAPGSWPEQIETAWKSFTKHYVSPAATPLAAAGGVLALLLVVSRLLTGTVVGPDVKDPGERSRRASWWIGGAYLVLSAVAVTVVFGLLVDLVSVQYRDVVVVGWVVLWGAVAAFGVWIVAGARGTALAVQVEVVDASGSVDTSQTKRLIAALTQLGSTQPRGLTSTGASDLTKLPEDALTEVPTGGVAKAVFALLRLVRPLPPWRLTVAVREGSAGTVTMTRNGRAVDDAVLVVPEIVFASEKEKKSDDDEQPATAVAPGDRLALAAASHALVVLSKRHRTLRPGLAGATRWRALAMLTMALATGQASDRRELLRQAVAAGPRYALARLAQVIDEETKTREQWLASAKDLERLHTEFGLLGPEGYEAFRVRLYYNLAVAWFNVSRFDTDELQTALHWEKSRAAEESLRRAVAHIDQGDDAKLQAFVDGVRPLVQFVTADVGAHRPGSPLGVARIRADYPLPTAHSAQELYAEACLYGGLDDLTGIDVALTSLAAAVEADPTLKETAREDASFRYFRGSGLDVERRRKFKSLVGDEAPKDYLELPLFEPHAQELKKLGFTDIRDILNATPVELVAATGVHRTVAAGWVRVARLGKSAPWKTTEGDDLAWLALFLDAEVDSPEAFFERRSDPAAFLAKLQEGAASTKLVVVQDETVDKWWTR
jgi:hypothetical protein